jgi:hypothetical protein
LDKENTFVPSWYDFDSLPDLYPTHRHPAAFWEQLGRVVASFVYLERILGQAIFALTATRPYPADEVDKAYENWQSKLEHALTDALGKLVENFAHAVKVHPNVEVEHLDELLLELRKVKKYRNVFCHGAWMHPLDEEGKCTPLFVSPDKLIFEMQIDIEFMKQIQRGVIKLSCRVMNTVTMMGFRFPGCWGPGKEIA